MDDVPLEIFETLIGLPPISTGANLHPSLAPVRPDTEDFFNACDAYDTSNPKSEIPTSCL